MKLNYLLKFIPLLSSLIFLTFFFLTNQKEYTKLKIVIWNTPRLSLGTYVALSTGSGFLFSYVLTTKLANINKQSIKKSIKYKTDYEDQLTNVNKDSYSSINHEKTLIERDIKDPSPTLNANFRVIGKINKMKSDFINRDNIQSDYSDISNVSGEDSYNDQQMIYDNYDSEIQKSNDWDDQSFLRW
ncbi:hypothetical protein [Prochlorococcus marinus]|uniref:hypothetical protein n=1 Tax=Prochlorococcus marinus TaxID=1219 RepID=UPI0022B52811|nr:hypothetical protein [Prochlorococcus marinus]